MSEESPQGQQDRPQRSAIDRRSSWDRRLENRGIRNWPFFRLFFDRRRRGDRRSDQERRVSEESTD